MTMLSPCLYYTHNTLVGPNNSPEPEHMERDDQEEDDDIPLAQITDRRKVVVNTESGRY